MLDFTALSCPNSSDNETFCNQLVLGMKIAFSLLLVLSINYKNILFIKST